MKKVKILIGVVIALALIAGAVVGFRISRDKKFKNMVANEDNQVEVIISIFNEYCKNKDGNITLDNKCYTNWITKESYSEENIKKLKALEIENGKAELEYVFKVGYDTGYNMLSVELNEKDGRYTGSQLYNISQKGGKLCYEANGLGKGIFRDFIN